MTRLSRRILPFAALCAAGTLLVPAPTQAKTSHATVERGLQGLVAAAGGPPGAVATLYRDGRLTTLRAGRADVRRAGAPRATHHMRIASVSKAYSGAVALNLVQQGRLGLDDTVGQRLPNGPPAWAGVTIRQLLNHTSGIPDYTQSAAFAGSVSKDPRAHLTTAQVLDFVRAEPLEFTPGSRYAYSNTDNIIIGLIAEAVTGAAYPKLLEDIVFAPAGLDETSFPVRRLALPRPAIRGYVVARGEEPSDVTTHLSPSGAWASGAIVATPKDLAAFIRADLGLKFFGADQQREQMTFVPGSSCPAGPGATASGLALFRYTTRCGVVYGHTGNFPGYTQFAAATADGSRSVTTSLNIPAPRGALLRRLRAVQADAVCAMLGR